MKDIEELNGKMVELLEDVQKTVNGPFSENAKKIIAEIAAYARKTQLYEDLEDQRKEFEEGAKESARTLYHFMLNRIVNAPTVFHRNASIILLIPIIDDRLKEEEQQC